MGFSRQEYWSGLAFSSPGHILNPGIEPTSPALAGSFFTAEPKGKSPLCRSIFKKTKMMASGPITSWQIDRETMETVTDFIFLGSKITADGDCSHEIKRCLLLGKRAMTNLNSILKSRHYFANKGPSSQSYGFSSSHVWLWELDYKEGWALKNWCLRLLRVPWTPGRSNQSILKEISPEYSLEGLMLKLKLQYLWEELIHWKRPWCWERLKAGGEGDDRGWDSWMASLTQWTWVWASSRSWWTGKPGVLQFMGLQRVVHDWATELKLELDLCSCCAN